MQVHAIIEAAVAVKNKGGDPHPEIMIPLVGSVEEMRNQATIVRRVAEEVFKEKGTKVDYKVGTMIELPRAALTADQIAEEAEFFSFGTNDLTQTTFGISRDDINQFLPAYMKAGIFKQDPFATLDQAGVGQLLKIATTKGRHTRPDLHLGICGEHGGDPESVKFCHRIGLDYVSCSPFRLLTARLAAAQAALEEKLTGPMHSNA
jgi:pyruvate,orthophosphate dikinase